MEASRTRSAWPPTGRVARPRRLKHGLTLGVTGPQTYVTRAGVW